jgi:hypothetical protein
MYLAMATEKYILDIVDGMKSMYHTDSVYLLGSSSALRRRGRGACLYLRINVLRAPRLPPPGQLIS